jgi:hypothetical protein
MAFLKDIKFIGSLGDLSAYRMKGVDEIVVRTKGGASKEHIKKARSAERTRMTNKEFGGCSSMGKAIREVMLAQRPLADYNYSGFINALMKVVQAQDKVSDLGKRNVMLSKHPAILEGFSLNKRLPFDSIIRSNIIRSVSRETRSATITIPALVPGINLVVPHNYPMFQVQVVLGIVPDFFYKQKNKKYEASRKYNGKFVQNLEKTAWYPAMDGSPAVTLEVNEKKVPPDQSFSVVVSIGICFGTIHGGGLVSQIQNAGAAKILSMA